MEKLSQQEEEAMQAVWQAGTGFIKDFLDQMNDPKPPYTTLASTIKNLERKGFVNGEKLGNSYRYTPAIAEEEYKKRFMSGFVSDYFKNSYKDLVTFFANEKKISATELKEILNLIEKPKL
ncbi:BlaI/MecI/CopY family transcriptional regulator [Mucilaginibacter terrigena]|uniref:BlaI/MecI/CopY family transcriptional regulator n=1 Tax=Mucilaginibacter terrigena TaxID=2492395 RepID=A0A4V1ZC60_9SPHI|nr:BlaI/MecI/CopY family transcriptional regulator [Mucilaginibacter terrigena]RYU91530.1 BlaI/MecI/CopY family transcriptional regulator [Mucilaginibacter terrigena]